MRDPLNADTCMRMIREHQETTGIPPKLEAMGASVWRDMARQAQHHGAVTGSGAAMKTARAKQRAQVKPAASSIETAAPAVRAKPAASSIETAAAAKAREDTVAKDALQAEAAEEASQAEGEKAEANAQQAEDALRQSELARSRRGCARLPRWPRMLAPQHARRKSKSARPTGPGGHLQSSRISQQGPLVPGAQLHQGRSRLALSTLAMLMAGEGILG